MFNSILVYWYGQIHYVHVFLQISYLLVCLCELYSMRACISLFHSKSLKLYQIWKYPLFLLIFNVPWSLFLGSDWFHLYCDCYSYKGYCKQNLWLCCTLLVVSFWLDSCLTCFWILSWYCMKSIISWFFSDMFLMYRRVTVDVFVV